MGGQRTKKPLKLYYFKILTQTLRKNREIVSNSSIKYEQY